MQTGAIIAAAGISTRMMQFKQWMKVENRAMAERVIQNCQRAGISDIAVVTGHRSAQLEKELHSFNITFLKNHAYQTTRMFESVKIGLKYFQGRCSRVLFCPVDIPFFMEKTVKALLAQDGDVVQPAYGGKSGHPILICASLIPEILAYSGEGGLRGALGAIPGLKRVRIPVDDEAILMDVNTRDDFERLASLHNAGLIHPSVEVSLESYKMLVNQQTAALLRGIIHTGSVREACIAAGISYSKGWGIIRDAEDGLGSQIVERQPGGKNGGAASVTERGLILLEAFEEYEKRVKRAAEEGYREIFLKSDLF